MPIPVGVQLGVELTNFIIPLTKTAFRLGSPAIREAIDRSGSDELTEIKLAHILGRARLDQSISAHFRSIVAHSHHAVLSRFLKELILESGAGPTVSHALAGDNAALLSMVVQVSFLAWYHDHQSLAQAIVQAVDDILVESKSAPSHGLNYVSLLGTVGACQQQTAAFSWEHHYRAIEDKIYSHIKNSGATSRHRTRRRLRSDRSSNQPQHRCVSQRQIPYVVLKALIKSLDSIQRFPEECLLQLSCNEGVSSVVLWCYHILGVSVVLRIFDTVIQFGDGPYNITVDACDPGQCSAVLLQRTAENAPVFNLVSGDGDPYLHSDQRVDAKGFLKFLLGTEGIQGDELVAHAGWLASQCLELLNSGSGPLADDNTIGTAAVNHDIPTGYTGTFHEEIGEPESMHRILQDEIFQAVTFLFDMNLEDLQGACTSRHRPIKRRGAWWASASALIFSFARVKHLDTSAPFPLSVDSFRTLSVENHGMTYTDALRGPVPDTIRCFELLSRLLLAALYTKEYVSKAFLISSRGWSVFLDTIDAVDPADVSSGSIHIKPGVPARHGIRKARIIDGMTDVGISSTRGIVVNDEPPIFFWPGVWSSKLVATHIGYHGQDAFTVVQTYEWGNSRQSRKKWRLGFREKQDMCMRFSILKGCPCDDQVSEDAVRCAIDKLLVWPANMAPNSQDTAESKVKQVCVAKHPETARDASHTPERVFNGGSDAWFFFVTGDGAARWLGLENFDHLSLDENKYPRIIRGRSCCADCAVRACTLRAPALVLL
ncbi:hypothetical protein ACRE_020630 [Hapsidospora chrysogenum ATCC 11550]|uniref:Uncharacterized protein n=1 Tax=Hapsidospora chrysogenum (strain ATCC 11550 / CBS 779.69 / DSM 880 / IAM 14645 / JCM 23072 / IMI 49137) TaxID=857340 RepID=A0A086TCH3_HAPC1|nr:hypothetical protein ACRE_020630 [Hapsidospora chrysogenum ATCC 11550]